MIIDIRAEPIHTKSQEKQWGVNMNPTDHQCYMPQRLKPPVGYCTSFVDRKWPLTSKRKWHENDILQRAGEDIQVMYK